jgi:hypothetical protein
MLGIDHLVIAVKSLEAAHTFDFVAPATPTSPLTAWLAARGPSPYAATFKGGAGRAGALDPERTHGARLALA